MPTYRAGTQKLIDVLQTAAAVQKHKETALVNRKEIRHIKLTAGDFERILPGKRELANKALRLRERAEELSAEDKRRISERTGKDVTLINHVINENKPHMADRGTILCAMLLRDDIPSAEEASHYLLSMRREELYTETCDKSTNCRNMILRLCLDYASTDPICPVADWLVFTNSVILWFNSQKGAQWLIHMEPLEVGAPDYGFIDSHRQLLAEWEQHLAKIGFCNLSDYRNRLLEAYMEKHGGESKSRTNTLNQLCEAINYDYRNAAFVFGKRPRKCSRELLVEFAIAMGCNLDETNQLLRQVPLPALYPNNGLDDAKDAYYVGKLDHGEGLGVMKKEENKNDGWNGEFV